MKSHPLRTLLPFLIIMVAALATARSVNAQTNVLPFLVDDSDAWSSTTTQETYFAKVPTILYSDFTTSFKAVRFIDASRFQRDMPVVTKDYLRYAWLAKLNFASAAAGSVKSGSNGQFDQEFGRRAVTATFTNMLGLQMARVERLRKFWWLPQVASIAVNFGEIRGEQVILAERERVPPVTLRFGARR